MNMMGSQRVSRKSVLRAYHESGHAVVADLLRRSRVGAIEPDHLIAGAPMGAGPAFANVNG